MRLVKVCKSIYVIGARVIRRMEGCYWVDEENAKGNKNKIVSKEMGYKN
jgi:hypothetical protein